MSDDRFHHNILQALAQKIPNKAALVAELSVLFNLHARAVYNRLNGETQFTLEEAILLARTYHLDFNQIAELQPEETTFSAPWLYRQPANPAAFLQALAQDMAWMGQLAQPVLHYATNDFPLFLGAYFPDLLKFKIFMWGRFIWNWPGYTHRIFRLEDTDFAGIDQQARTIVALYQAIPAIDFWSPTLLDHTVSQLRYLLATGAVSDRNVIDKLLSDLHAMLELANRMAANGYKGKEPGSALFQLYRTDLMNHGVTLMVEWETGRRVYATIDSPNSLYTETAAFTVHTADWFRRLSAAAVPVAGSNEQERGLFFRGIREKILL